MYDQNNVFAKIINGEIPAEKLYEDDEIIAIKDINPAAPVHILVLPKGQYIDFSDFVSRASAEKIQHYFKTIEKIAQEHISPREGEKNYRLVTNKGIKAGQSVFHFHTHILSGQLDEMTDNQLIDKNL